MIFRMVGTGLLLILIGMAAAVADQFDTVNYSATEGITYDNNVFRLPPGTDPQLVVGKPSKSDVIRLTSFGINIDKKYSNQEFLFNAKVTNNNYHTFSNLDYNGTSYKAASNWSLTSKLNGTLSSDRTQTLTSFADIRTTTRNLITEDNQRLNADWWFQSDWHLLFGVSSGGTTSTVTTINSLSYNTKTTELGLKYFPASDSSIALTSRNIRGGYNNTSPDYVQLIDTGYTEKQEELQINWLLTGKSVLTGDLMSVKRQYPLFFQRDYNGIQGSISNAWSISDKTHLNMSMNRSINLWFDTYSSYFVIDTISIAPSWQISAKTDMHLTLSGSKSDFRGPVVANASTRHDANQLFEIGFGWTPQRAVTFSALAQHTWHASNYSAFEFNDSLASLTVSGTF